jgi:hypothetical protein
MKNTLLALVLAATPLAGFAADDLSYNYVEGDYMKLDHGADGPALRGSVEFGKSGVYATGNYAWLRADDGLGGNVDVHARELGLGYHHGVAANTDVIGELGYRKASAAGTSAEGGRASIGVRSSFGKHAEGYVKGNYYDGADYHGDATGTVGGQYKFNGMWGVTAEAELGNGDHAYLAGVRASFK